MEVPRKETYGGRAEPGTIVAELPANPEVVKGIAPNQWRMMDTKEKIQQWLVVYPDPERRHGAGYVVSAEVYMGKGREATTVYCTLLAYPQGGSYSLSGYGTAGGGGYDKRSAAVQSALRAAGVSHWVEHDDKALGRRLFNCGGVGEQATADALVSLAIALGYPADRLMLIRT